MKFKLALLSTIAVLRRHRDDTIAYIATIPTRIKVTSARTASRLGEAAVALAAKLHAATTDEKRKTWLRRIREWRQSVRVEELTLGDARTASGGRVIVTGKGNDKVVRFRASSYRFEDAQGRFYGVKKSDIAAISEATGIDADAITAKLDKAN